MVVPSQMLLWYWMQGVEGKVQGDDSKQYWHVDVDYEGLGPVIRINNNPMN